MLRDLQACLGLKDHLDLREPVGTQVLREIMGPSDLQEHRDQLANFPPSTCFLFQLDAPFKPGRS